MNRAYLEKLGGILARCPKEDVLELFLFIMDRTGITTQEIINAQFIAGLKK